VRVLDLQEGRLAKDRDANLEFVGLGADHVKGGMVDRETVDEATKGVDVVYHLALNWDGHTWSGRMPLADLLDVNIRGTLNLLEAATTHGVKHFLYASSVAVYGKRDSLVMDEETTCRPELWRGGPGPAYAIMKLAIERLCLFYHLERELPVTVFQIDVVFDDDEYQDLNPEAILAEGLPDGHVQCEGLWRGSEPLESQNLHQRPGGMQARYRFDWLEKQH